MNTGLLQNNLTYYWNVIASDGIYSTASIDTFEFYTNQPNSVSNGSSSLPNQYKLYQNYPNPFNPSTLIKYDLPERSDVQIKIFNVLGQSVFSYDQKNQSAGNYQIKFNADFLTSGIYIYRIVTDDFVETKRMMLLK